MLSRKELRGWILRPVDSTSNYKIWNEPKVIGISTFQCWIRWSYKFILEVFHIRVPSDLIDMKLVFCFINLTIACDLSLFGYHVDAVHCRAMCALDECKKQKNRNW